MEDHRVDAGALAAAMAPMVGLEVTPEQRPGVCLHLEATRKIALQVMRFATPERTENAPVFRP